MVRGVSTEKVREGSAYYQNVESLRTDEERITSDTLRVYKESVGTYEDYQIGDYADIGEAITQAASDQVTTHSYGETGGKIRLPTTHSLTTTTADLADGTVLAGAGIRSSAIEADAGMTAPLVRHAPSSGRSEFFQGVRDLRIDGNDESCVGYQLDNSNGQTPDHHVKEIIVRDTGDRAMDITGGWGLRVDNALIEGCGAGATHCIFTMGTEQHWRGCFISYNEATYTFTTWGSGDETAYANKSFVDHSIYENMGHGVLVRKYGQKFVSPTISGNGRDNPGAYDGMSIGLSSSRDGEDTIIQGGIFNGYSQKAGQNVTDVGLHIYSPNVIVSGGTFQNHVSEDIIVDASDCVLEGIHCYGDVTLTSNATSCRVSGRVKGTLTDNGTSNDTAGVV